MDAFTGSMHKLIQYDVRRGVVEVEFIEVWYKFTISLLRVRSERRCQFTPLCFMLSIPCVISLQIHSFNCINKRN